MKNIMNIIAALTVALVMPLSVLAATTVPAIPVMYYGNVVIDGSDAAVGAKVTANVGGVEVASFKLTEKGKYCLNISTDNVAAGKEIKFEVNEKNAGNTTMVSTQGSSVELNLAVIASNSNNPSSGGSSRPATPATPADPKTDTPAIPAIPATGNGQVKGDTDLNIIDGDIIQCKSSANPNAVYIVKVVNGKKYIRHIVSLQIFNHYKHLKWENLIQVGSLDGFSLSGWVRVNTGANGAPGANDKVWEINGDQTRHWIDMTAAEFLLHGGSEEAIYSINAGELGLYKEGSAVKLK